MKSSLPALVVLLILVTGCAAIQPSGAQSPERLSQQVARDTLARAQQAYDDGDYARTISTLRGSGSVLDAAEPTTRLAAMKLEAFSYCVSNQVTECRLQFVRILQVFPSFDLSVAERNHPLWGPAFETAKKMKR